ncbi:hypothetical protein ACJW30_07G139300 [Castanea mollissima]
MYAERKLKTFEIVINLWEKNVETHAKEKVSRLHFYFHDTLSGKNPSAVEVAEASITKKSPTLFGLLNIFDDPLTEGPEPTSKLVGRARIVGLLSARNLVFTTGKFNGSGLTILGRNLRNAMFHAIREMPIIGGLVLFDWHVDFCNLTSGDAIMGYHVVGLVAIHY